MNTITTKPKIWRGNYLKKEYLAAWNPNREKRLISGPGKNIRTCPKEKSWILKGTGKSLIQKEGPAQG